MSSFKLPKSLEPFGFEKIEKVDKLKNGDMVVIPSIEDEKRLRVSIPTLRKWGLKVVSGYQNRYGYAKYEAARRAFANYKWYGATKKDLNAHMFILDEIEVDTNAEYEGQAPQFSMSFENANSIDDPGVDVTPDLPVICARMSPFSPISLCDREYHPYGNNYPSSLTMNTDEQAYDMLISAVNGLPYSSAVYQHGDFGENDFDLKYFLSIVNGMLNDNCITNLTGIVQPGIIKYGGNVLAAPRGTASVIMTAIKHDVRKTDHAGYYFPNSMNDCFNMSMNATREFLLNLMNHGALFYRSEKFTKAASAFHASEVARIMANRYTDLKNAVTKIMKGFESEVPKIDNLIARFEKAKTDLSLKNEVKDAMKYICGN